MKNTIKAVIMADSISHQGSRITTYLLTYPRFIHSELMTHRMFSRNSASSRAIPFEKMVKMVEKDPFIPIAWQLDHKGMQGTEYADETLSEILTQQWIEASKEVILRAKLLNAANATKQLCNRLLEPFMWHTVLVTATEFDNFFELRCPKYTYIGEGDAKEFKSKKDFLQFANFDDPQVNWNKVDWQGINTSQADIHIQALAEAMWDAKNESKPNQLLAGEWHMPFSDKIIDYEKLKYIVKADGSKASEQDIIDNNLIKIATARCARLSYMTFDNKIDYEKDIQLHDRLLADGHMSCFEHCAKAMNSDEYFAFYKGFCDASTTEEEDAANQGWCNNFQGFIPYRYLIENKQ